MRNKHLADRFGPSWEPQLFGGFDNLISDAKDVASALGTVLVWLVTGFLALLLVLGFAWAVSSILAGPVTGGSIFGILGLAYLCGFFKKS